MIRQKINFLLMLTLLCCAIVLSPARKVSAQGDEGFNHKVPAVTQGDERSRQPSLWVMEVHLKPMRLIWVNMPDKKTGELKPELFHYICYRAINRPIKKPEALKTVPLNRPDPEPGPTFFIPEFTLIPNDSDQKQVFLDEIVHRAVDTISRKERRQFKNNVNIVGQVPKATNEKPNDQNALYGVAVFRGIDPKVDRMTVLMSGFSNAYEVKEGPGGETVLSRKTIRQKIWRPGDKFDPESLEFRYIGEPEWIYRPDSNPTKK